MATTQANFNLYKVTNPGTFTDPKAQFTYGAVPGDLPQGATATNYQDFLTNATPQNQAQLAGDLKNAFGYQGDVASAFNGGDSGFRMQDGVLTTQKAIDSQAAEATKANDPNQVNVGTAQAPEYAPKGSAGAANAANFGTQNTANALNAGTMPTGAGGQPVATPADIAKQGLAQAQASGKEAPQSAGEAAGAISALTSSGTNTAATQAAQNASIAKVNSTLANDPGYQQLLADATAAKNVVTQSQTLVSQYQQMIATAGIPAIDTQLLNTQKIINGTEDDIRHEVQAASGFATDSQVLALASARNKTLIQNYNNLLATKQSAMDQINTMIGLAGQDRQNAIQAANQQLQIDQQLADYAQKFQVNAQEAYKNVVAAVGYVGLLSSLQASGDPNAVSLAEQTLGFQPGQLASIAQQQQNQTNLANIQAQGITTPYYNYGGEIQNTQTGQGYTSEADFLAKTGMSLQDAQKKGLISSSGTTAQLAQLDVAAKQASINASNASAASSSASAAKTRLETQQLQNGGGTLPGSTIPLALTPYAKTSWDGTQYADLSSLAPTDKAKYAQIAAQAGLTPILDAGTAGKLNGISVSKENLQNIQQSLTGILNNGSPGLSQGLGNSLKSLLGNADIKSFQAWRTAVINNVQALAGGQGSGLRINQAEIDTALKNDLPVITGSGADTLAQAQAKIAKLNSQLDTWTKQILGGGNTAAGSNNDPLGLGL